MGATQVNSPFDLVINQLIRDISIDARLDAMQSQIDYIRLDVTDYKYAIEQIKTELLDDDNDPDFLSAERAAPRAGCSPDTICRECRAGTLQARKIKGAWRIDPEALDIWIADRANLQDCQRRLPRR
jgi:hypothetical protein